MVSPKQLLSVIESTLLARSPPTAAQRIELIHAIRQSLPSFKALLSYPPPKPSDRAQVQSKEVRLRDAGPISLDDQDVQIALKLSEDLYLNEIDCVHLIVSANQEWGLLGREPLEIFRLAAGLWYTERRDLLTAIYTLLRAVVLDQGLDVDLVTDIQSYLEDLISSGLRQRLVSLIKELSREEPRGLGGPSCESYFLDSKGALVERKAVISRERLILGHCLVLSILVERASSKDIKDIFSERECRGTQWGLGLLEASDALSTVPNKAPVLSQDASFRREFHEIVMVAGNDTVVEGFVDCVRLAWVVHLIMVQDGNDAKETLNSTLSNDMKSVCSCLDVVFANNVFQFWLDKILHTAAYQNDDEDMVYMYNAYLHKQMTCFLSHPLARDKVKEAKEKAMAMLSPYRPAATHNQMIEGSGHPPETSEAVREPFVSLLEFVSEIYQKEPELLSGNDVIWTFVKFAGEDHTNFQTLVAFLKMLSTLACNPEGASKVFELLQGKTFRLIGWSTLFECLSIYEDKFKHSLQSPGAVLPEFQEGDAKALVAYLTVLKQVVENGNPIERKNWFPDIEPLFKLLSYENVPPYLKGALRNAIATFVQVSPIMKDTIWRYLEQYDLPVVVGPNVGNSGSATDTQVYDMRFELNEVEARREQYPSTISFINLLNSLIAEERDVSDRGRRFIGIFRFIYDHVFGPFPQRAYADPSEKWQLVVACLKHFQMMLSMYDVGDEDSDAVTDQSHISVMGHSSPIHMQLPVVEVLKRIRNVCLLVFLGLFTPYPMACCSSLLPYNSCSEAACLFTHEVPKIHLPHPECVSQMLKLSKSCAQSWSKAYQNFCYPLNLYFVPSFPKCHKDARRSVLFCVFIYDRKQSAYPFEGVNFLITERTNQIYGQLLEKAVQLSLEIIILVMEKDSIVSDFWRPLYQPLDVILSQDPNQVVALLEYVRYDFQPQIQLCSIKILSILRQSFHFVSSVFTFDYSL
ncbi:UNVERIFIED_CONTAM: Nuclear pore complex protein [Sesamum calycinum]|uniref:Nuclear pore complex protein n=1 Tax=Sesamum calycinum TaxID=2727403 RepID=A0AAW2NRV4_9LAMI